MAPPRAAPLSEKQRKNHGAKVNLDFKSFALQNEGQGAITHSSSRDEIDTQALEKQVRVRCRQITDCDLDGVANLLAAGFPRRHRERWAKALQLLSRREPPWGFPRYGYMLEKG